MGQISEWFVYMLRCADNSLYTGVTTDVKRRLKEHNEDKAGAKYTRAKRPVSLVYEETAESRSAACQREYQLKKLKKSDKESFVRGELKVSLLNTADTAVSKGK
ncbi:GIY-YIG nuclease family protein [Cocleimonas sp. KMM 6892]|uniref:GIY-YIG nuclease family protein n=1 Tax=unclassified Cocleimonas TaxID=2639732 RepID=UPI002DBE6A36|nr:MULTISPECIES: GIY-YIG nuclease family protein [unclassified Cocleimonas]MEB8433152.1 GIY-YIG nuclease family protein [Cocleimonas sp. KMM 6892]MEC4715867.1 GIY-YIG nuclease family protein [Cocleimonas sp. KMM 6895]MEC4745328.1 GIY-YIG nuclease family protein [Cocleimonas sp. KMM 6896]